MKSLQEMTTEELEKAVREAYGDYMFEEAAERGYDYVAARKAQQKYFELNAELKKRSV